MQWPWQLNSRAAESCLTESLCGRTSLHKCGRFRVCDPRSFRWISKLHLKPVLFHLHLQKRLFRGLCCVRHVQNIESKARTKHSPAMHDGISFSVFLLLCLYAMFIWQLHQGYVSLGHTLLYSNLRCQKGFGIRMQESDNCISIVNIGN